MLRAATYGRFSSPHQPDHSTVDQRELAIEYAERNGMKIVTHFSDDAKTGRRARNRDGFQALCNAVRAKLIDVVIIEIADRIARNTRIGAGFYDLIEHHGIEVHSLGGRVESLVFKMSIVVAEHQSRDNAVRTRARQIQRLKATGRVVAGLAYGYEEVEGDGLNRRIVDAEAEVVRRIYEEYANGLSPNEIARRLNAEGIPGPRGMPWSNTTIRGDRARMTGIIRNPIYVGRILYGRTRFSIDPDTDTRKSSPAKSTDDIIEHESPELRIIDQDLWEAVQARLDSTAWTIKRDNKGRAMNRAHRKQFLLSGLLICGCCGKPYAIMAKDRYGCSTRKNKGTCDNAVTIKREHIEGRVLTGIKSRLLAGDLVERFVGRAQAAWEQIRKAEAREAGKTKRDLAACERQIGNLLDMIEQGLGNRTIVERLAAREAEKTELEGRLAEAASEAAPTVLTLPNFAQAYAAQVDELENVLRDPNLVQPAHETLAKLIEKVVLTPDPEAQNGLRVDLHGDLARILATCAAARNEELPAGFLRAGSQLSVVAGVGFEPTTFRL